MGEIPYDRDSTFKGLKVIKIGKTSKLLKPSRGLKGVKVGQKTGKLVRKTRKLLRKKLSE